MEINLEPSQFENIFPFGIVDPFEGNSNKDLLCLIGICFIAFFLYFMFPLFKNNALVGSVENGESGLKQGYSSSSSLSVSFKPLQKKIIINEKKLTAVKKELELIEKPSAKNSNKNSAPESLRLSDKNEANGGKEGDYHDYLATIVAQLNLYKEYNRLAMRRGLEGTTTIKFIVARDGSVSDNFIVKSSGHFLIDQSVLDMLARAAPFPAIPDKLEKSEIKVLIPISFTLLIANRFVI